MQAPHGFCTCKNGIFIYQTYDCARNSPNFMVYAGTRDEVNALVNEDVQGLDQYSAGKSALLEPFGKQQRQLQLQLQLQLQP